MLRADRLGPDALLLGEREFRVGDRVLCRQNDPRLGLRNGTRATITDLDQTTLTLRTDQGALRRTPVAYAAKHLDHGYALTGHAAQGATVDRAFVLVEDRGALQEWGYVACSRARRETRLYLATPPLDPDLPGRAPQRDQVPERVVHALTASASEPLAIDQTDRDRRTTERSSQCANASKSNNEPEPNSDSPTPKRSSTNSDGAAGANTAPSSAPRSTSNAWRSDSQTRSVPKRRRCESLPAASPPSSTHKRSRELEQRREPIEKVRQRTPKRERDFGLER